MAIDSLLVSIVSAVRSVLHIFDAVVVSHANMSVSLIDSSTGKTKQQESESELND